MSKIRTMAAVVLMAVAIGSVGRGIVVTTRLHHEMEARRAQQEATFNADPVHAPIPDYSPAPTLFDGPWLFIEFACLGGFVVVVRTRKTEEERDAE